MKKVAAISTAALLALGSYAAAQEVLLDDFETGIDGWTNSQGFPVLVHNTTDGAEGTNGSLQVNDGGFSKGVARTYEGMVPEDGLYKVTFWFKNGIDGGDPWPELRVRIDGDHTVNVGSATVTEWTQDETGVASLEEDVDFELEVFGASTPGGDFRIRVDQIYLVPVDVEPIGGRISPPSGLIVAGTQAVEVFPTGGTGNYVQADFYLNDTLVHTDDTPGDGFTWEFDTTTEPDVTVDVRVEVTDDDANTGDIEASLVIDNLLGRTDNLVENGSFDSWDGGVPTSWTQMNIDSGGNEDPSPGVVVIQEDENPFVGPFALGLEYAESPDPYRYAFLSNPFDANRFDYQAWLALRGSSFSRLYYFYTEDGVTWTTSFQGPAPGPGPVWLEYVDSPMTPEQDPRPQAMAVGTHFFGAGTGYWDAVHVAASEESVEPVSVEQWDLYH